MAEPDPKPTIAPNLAAVPDPLAPEPAQAETASEPAQTETVPEPPGRRGAPWWLFGLVVILLAFTLWGLYEQTGRARAQAQQITALSGQIQGLETEVSTLDTLVTSFGMQRDLVAISVGDLAERLANLQTLVKWDPRKPRAGPPAEARPSAPAAPAVEPEAAASAEESAPAEPGAAEPVEPESGVAPELDLDSVPGLKPGPSLELAPRGGADYRINGV